MELHLKPCPHCGSEAKLNTITDDPERPDYQGNYISCEACGATTQLMFSTGEDCRPILAELWNARHSEPPQAGQRLADSSKTTDLQDRPLKLGQKVPTAIYTASDEPVCVVDSMHERADDCAVARRLVACWNACQGLSTQSLESMPGNFFGHTSTMRPLMRQSIEDVMTEHYPLESLLRERLDAFEKCVRDIEQRLKIGG